MRGVALTLRACARVRVYVPQLEVIENGVDADDVDRVERHNVDGDVRAGRRCYRTFMQNAR